MKRRELRQHMEQLAAELDFRWVDKSKRFIGIHRGILIEVSEWSGDVSFQFSSPTAQVRKEILEDFAGFTQLGEAGIPTTWIRALMERDANGHETASEAGCWLSIDTNRIDSIGVEAFHQIPDLVVADLHSHGASETLTCFNCGKQDASTVRLLNYAFTPMCEDCWNELQFHVSGGKLATEQSVNWEFVLPMLAILTAVAGFVWGFLQQPQRLANFGMLAILLPAGWAYGLCWTISCVCGGVTRMLRLSLFASVIVSVLAGNIWGYRSFTIKQLENLFDQPIIRPGWVESIELYFDAIPHIWQGEIPFLIGGILGAWIGLRHLKSEETIQVQ